MLLESFARVLAPIAALLLAASLGAQDQAAAEPEDAALDWPRQIEVERGTVTIYQPQLEDFDGDRLSARFAVSVQLEGSDAPQFGAAWLKARVATDRDAREVTLSSLEIPDLRFPDADQGEAAQLQTLLTRELSSYDIVLSLDRLLASLAAIRGESDAADELRSDPPKIIYLDHPAMLVTLDGEPAMEKVEDVSLMRVVNTPYFLVFAPPTRTHYLFGGSEWLRSEEIEGPWERAAAVPSAVSKLAREAGFELEEAAEGSADDMPQVIVATEPTELLVTDGKPRYSPLGSSDLMYVDNSDNDLLLDISDQHHYALISGRWYRAEQLDGGWQHVPHDELPEAFSQIPIGSAKEDLRVSVPGTDEAREAVLDAEIPQTAVIPRDGTQPEVSYDGEPEFVDIEGTSMQYAVNTGAAVLLIEGRYYLCAEAVWYESDAPTGPWSVCTAVPPQVQDIPPSCPLYYLRYVEIYDSNDDEVYVGYTPGYTGCYVYYGVVVYGTGWRYRPWWRHRYYARPCTWGLRVRYNPRSGHWGFRVGYRGRRGGVVVGRGGWWGAGGYRSVNVNVHVHGGARSTHYRHNLYDHRGKGSAGRPGDRVPAATPMPADRNRLDRQHGSEQHRGQNNVYADRNGQVHRRTDQGWERHDKSGWQREQKPASTPERQPSTKQPSRSYDRSQLERQHQARQRGTQRTNQYRSSRSRSPSRGGMRGGGRGRR